MKKTLENIIENIILSEPDFESGSDMLNHCSYFSCLFMKELYRLGISSSYINMSLAANNLPFDSYFKSKDYCNHNVVLVEEFIVDITFSQFGSLIKSNLMTKEEYFKIPWIIKSETSSEKLNLT